MRRFLIGVLAAIIAASAVIIAPPATAISWPICNQVTQPTMPEPVLTADGVRFLWTGGSVPQQDYFVWFNRLNNGQWGEGSFVDVGKGTSHFEKWIDGNGIRSEGLYLAPFIYCVGQIQGPNQTVMYSQWQAIEAQQQAEEQKRIDGLVAAQLATTQPQSLPPKKKKKKKRVECVNKRTDEIKIFARWKCPKRWKKY